MIIKPPLISLGDSYHGWQCSIASLPSYATKQIHSL